MLRGCSMVLMAGILVLSPVAGAADGYVCPPCDADCHSDVYDQRGPCPTCGMALQPKAGSTPTAKTPNPATYGEVSPQELCKIVELNKDVVLLDVRTPAEFEGRGNLGRLAGARNIPVQELQSRLDELAGVKDREIIVYCSHSIRSPRAARLLVHEGFKDAKNLLGGLGAWNASTLDALPCRDSLLTGKQ